MLAHRCRLTVAWVIRPHFPLTIPDSPVEKHGSPEAAARALRATWRIPLGPIGNLLEWLEAAGVFVVFVDFGTPKISAISLWPPGEQPIVLVNADMPPCRQRFTLAHELGHLVMHTEPEPTMEDEADRFAGELLMPEADMRGQLRNFNLQLAARLKPLWRVSMAALITRAWQLGIVTDRQRTSLHVQMSQKGWNRIEPVQIPAEEPSLINSMIGIHRNDHGYLPDDLAHLVGMSSREWAQTYEPRRLRSVTARR